MNTALDKTLKALKQRLLQDLEVVCQQTGLNFTVEGQTHWVRWDNMTMSERKQYPDAEARGGFHRIGIKARAGMSV